jgi:hypothetical protein
MRKFTKGKVRKIEGQWYLILADGRKYHLPKTVTFTANQLAAYKRMLFGGTDESANDNRAC